MADAVSTHGVEFVGGREKAAFEYGGLVTEATAGAAVVVLAILGLMHVAPDALASISTIVLGAAFLLLGGMMAARFVRVMRSISSPATREVISEGATMASLCGAAGIVLGVLAFVSGDPTTLIPVAAVVFGAALLVARGTTSRLNQALADWQQEHAKQSARPVEDAVYVALAPGVLIALPGIILGIIALAGHAPILLSLVALLGLGVGVVLTGTSFASTLTTTLSS
jgi:hypothetical protein